MRAMHSMSMKSSRLTSLFCAVCLTGCVVLMGCASSGDDQNYKVLEEPQSTPRGDYSDAGSREGRWVTAPVRKMTYAEIKAAALKPYPGAKPLTAQKDAKRRPLRTAKGQPVVAHDAVDVSYLEPLNETSGSVTGLDRSDWGKMVLVPVDGSVEHNPVYWKDRRFGSRYAFRTDPSKANVDDALGAALAEGEYELFTKENGMSVVLQPLKFLTDTALLPVRAAYKRPLESTQSP